MWCGEVWCGEVWCGVVWCGVMWCGVVWCGVVWCGVVWRGTVQRIFTWARSEMHLHALQCGCMWDRDERLPGSAAILLPNTFPGVQRSARIYAQRAWGRNHDPKSSSCQMANIPEARPATLPLLQHPQLTKQVWDMAHPQKATAPAPLPYVEAPVSGRTQGQQTDPPARSCSLRPPPPYLGSDGAGSYNGACPCPPPWPAEYPTTTAPSGAEAGPGHVCDQRRSPAPETQLHCARRSTWRPCPSATTLTRLMVDPVPCACPVRTLHMLAACPGHVLVHALGGPCACTVHAMRGTVPAQCVASAGPG